MVEYAVSNETIGHITQGSDAPLHIGMSNLHNYQNQTDMIIKRLYENIKRGGNNYAITR